MGHMYYPYNVGDDGRALRWMGDTLAILRTFPAVVQSQVGFALREVQEGGTPLDVKVMQGFGGAGVVEIRERYDGNAYRAVYAVRLRHAIYVLHVFQKKSTRGIATAKPDIEMIRPISRSRSIA